MYHNSQPQGTGLPSDTSEAEGGVLNKAIKQWE